MKFLSYSFTSFALVSFFFFLGSPFVSTSLLSKEKSESINDLCDCLIDVGEDVEIELGDSVQLDVIASCQFNQIETIEWNNSESLSCDDCLEPYARPFENVCYTVSVTWTDACVSTEEVCVFVQSCNVSYTENAINSVSPEEIGDQAEIELEIAKTQYAYIEIVEDDEVLYPIWEGWLKSGLRTISLDFSAVPAGSYDLQARLYPENQVISIQKQ